MTPPFLRPQFILAVASLALAGCASPDRSERSSEVTATGSASIEGYTSPGMKLTKLRVLHIDKELVQPKGMKGVYPLAPGTRELHVTCEFSRLVPTLIIDAGDAVFQLEAKPKTRYRLAAKKVSENSAEMWIEDVTNARDATERRTVPLNANPQQVPLIIPVPVS